MSTREDLISLKSAKVAFIDLEIDETTPWHYHSEVIEHIICLSGSVSLQIKKPKSSTKMQLSRRYIIKPMQEHRLVNTGKTTATYLLIQNGNYDFISSNS